ncbi:hypothetical protein BVC80_887g114 [Macleaya cordata]|uniref:Exopolyphosphatase n=1 Tax=Macleaya cordata TaxID=56857 RepID=A0A200RDQ3_MACCD|nr:hypothetical protein BVC80_887g114 [Macleaya cordata]
MMENRKPISRPPDEPVPDVADLLDGWFFGSVNRDNSNNNNKAAYNVKTTGGFMEDDDVDDDDDGVLGSSKNSSSNNNSRLTQEWLHEAKLLVASSPARNFDSPSRLVGSPKFASTGSKDQLDRRDPLSRSARRHRAVESFSGEILSKSARHSRNKSETLESSKPPAEASPASAVHQWFSNIFNPQPHPDPKQHQQQQQNHHHHHHHHQDSSDSDQPDSIPAKPPRQPIIRKSRFRDNSAPTEPQSTKPVLSRRTFKNPADSAAPDNLLLSPPKNLTESALRRSISSSTCSLSENQLLLSPPRNLVESTHRRSISSSTCSLDKVSLRPDSNGNSKVVVGDDGARDLNVFLKEQRSKIGRISNGEINAKARFVLSGSSNSTSSMVAAICYAWLLENTIKNSKEEKDVSSVVVAPVMNMKRRRMWKQRQVAWLFHHVGIDASSLLFSDEVDLESLMMTKQLSMLVIGQDVLKTNGEVGSQCTILTDNYCEDAYDLLQTPILKKLLLAGIMLDTQNLNSTANFCTNRDAEAVQLLLVGSSPNYRNALFEQLMQDQRDGSFLEALRYNYGKPPSKSDDENGETVEHRVSVKATTTPTLNKNPNDAKSVKTNTVSPKKAPAPLTPAQAPEASRGKNKFFLAKWFGFGSK